MGRPLGRSPEIERDLDAAKLIAQEVSLRFGINYVSEETFNVISEM